MFAWDESKIICLALAAVSTEPDVTNLANRRLSDSVSFGGRPALGMGVVKLLLLLNRETVMCKMWVLAQIFRVDNPCCMRVLMCSLVNCEIGFMAGASRKMVDLSYCLTD